MNYLQIAMTHRKFMNNLEVEKSNGLKYILTGEKEGKFTLMWWRLFFEKVVKSFWM